MHTYKSTYIISASTFLFDIHKLFNFITPLPIQIPQACKSCMWLQKTTPAAPAAELRPFINNCKMTAPRVRASQTKGCSVQLMTIVTIKVRLSTSNNYIFYSCSSESQGLKTQINIYMKLRVHSPQFSAFSSHVMVSKEKHLCWKMKVWCYQKKNSFSGVCLQGLLL